MATCKIYLLFFDNEKQTTILISHLFLYSTLSLPSPILSHSLPSQTYFFLLLLLLVLILPPSKLEVLTISSINSSFSLYLFLNSSSPWLSFLQLPCLSFFFCVPLLLFLCLLPPHFPLLPPSCPSP